MPQVYSDKNIDKNGVEINGIEGSMSFHLTDLTEKKSQG